MSNAETAGPLLAADGTPLKQRLARAMRRQRMRALLLIAPLLLFVVVTFVFPIGTMLVRSVDNAIVPETLPATVASLADWDPASGELPSEQSFAALVQDLKRAYKTKTHTRVGSRLNYEHPGMSGLFRKSARKLKRLKDAPYRPQLIAINDRWGEVETWKTIKRFSGHYTPGYFMAASDLTVDEQGGVVRAPERERIYLFLFVRTILLSLLITVFTLLLGYPVAYLLANLPLRTSNLLMILVLLPFWTSLLVRTAAWIVLLQQKGVINELLVWTGVIDDGNRLDLMFNQTGTIVAMTHILLPFMILPLYSVMRTISPVYVRAARSLGASSWTAFWRVYFPNTVPGIGAGGILVFILSIGYYITPDLVGGVSGVFISNRIAYHMSYSLNWGLGAALAVILLTMVMVLYYLYDRIVGIDNVKLG